VTARGPTALLPRPGIDPRSGDVRHEAINFPTQVLKAVLVATPPGARGLFERILRFSQFLLGGADGFLALPDDLRRRSVPLRGGEARLSRNQRRSGQR